MPERMITRLKNAETEKISHQDYFKIGRVAGNTKTLRFVIH